MSMELVLGLPSVQLASRQPSFLHAVFSVGRVGELRVYVCESQTQFESPLALSGCAWGEGLTYRPEGYRVPGSTNAGKRPLWPVRRLKQVVLCPHFGI